MWLGESEGPYQASVCVCQKGCGKSGKQIIRTACTKQAEASKVCLLMKYFYIFLGIRKPVSLSCTSGTRQAQSRSVFNMHLGFFC